MEYRKDNYFGKKMKLSVLTYPFHLIRMIYEI